MPTTTPFQNLITFSRGSNATVTGPDGLIQWAPANLLTFSEQFDNAAWTKAGATISANFATAPDGTLTADKLVETATTGSHQAYSGVFSSVIGTVTYSLRVKAAERSWIFVADNTGGVYFNVANGTVGTASGGRTGSITAAGNGFYVCAVTGTWSGTQQIYFVAATGDGVSSYTGTAGSGLLIWGAQLELGSTATTYNPTTVKNLLGFSEDYNAGVWTKTGVSIVSGAQANPINGLFNAQKLMENTTTGEHIAYNGGVNVGAGPVTASIYAKPAGRDWIVIRETLSDGTSYVNTFFNIATGTVGTVGAGRTASIVNAGNGWYRCSITTTSNAAASRFVGFETSTNGSVFSYTGDGSSGVYIYGAQLSDSASLDPYVPTPGAAPSSTAYYGPRFDYDPVTRQPKGILIEEARTNLLTYSEQFDNAAWVKFNATVTANSTTAPDGTTTADALFETAATGEHQAFQTVTVSASTIHTVSVYVKANGRTKGSLQCYRSTATFEGFEINFDLIAKTVTSSPVSTGTVTASGIQELANGWFRIFGTGTFSTATTVAFVARCLNDAGASVYTGDTSKGLFIWGAQLEAGAFATSYIPTIASTVTRSADVASMIGANFSSWYNPAEGAFVVSGTSVTVGNDAKFLSITDGTASGQNNCLTMDLSSGKTRFLVVASGVSQCAFNSTATYTSGNVVNIAGAYKQNDFGGTTNGEAITTDTTGNVPSVSVMEIGYHRYGSPLQWINGHIRSVDFIPFRSANFQLQNVTRQPPWNVLAADGTLYNIGVYSARTADGTAYAVPQTVLSSTGISYNVI